ncbi:SMI1/KNR4 family protein [Kangiella aquimarina]|uniref:SMI1/KNR4 family protein n=1 Tax=Kangiella aquimarina TaxID=261965 RepID=A0ABZ0X7S4_9GAMM|nr:SMI1/KNR4 family protein [Kangiella aquimarina]WQG86414.1 SMI1/KNR4 family protein [Kangiella aquimarina]
MISELKSLIEEHFGVFKCVEIGNENNCKEVSFKHSVGLLKDCSDLPKVGDIPDFYHAFGSLTLYHDEVSGDSAVYIANPKQWPELHNYFSDWVGDLDEDEKEELVPEWVDTCIVIGEIPATGNYLLVPTTGEKTGHVYLFEHDGFEFIELASNIEAYIHRMLNLDSHMLTQIASHMRFIEKDNYNQWWIKELRDNKGNLVKTNDD